MNLSLVRKWVSDKSTIGECSIGDKFTCFMLEPPPGKCIPPGRYEIVVMHSPRMSALAGRPVDTPRLLNVPGFEGILIHSGNFPIDTKGCLLPGRGRLLDEVLHSHDAYTELFFDIRAARAKGELVFIDITDAPKEKDNGSA